MSVNDGQKRTEEALRLVEKRYHTIFRNTPAGMVLGFPDGRLIEVNPAFCRFLGYGEEELLQLTGEELTHPDDRELSRWQREAVLNGKISSYTYEKRFLRKDGSTVWGQVSGNWSYDADGRPVYLVGLIQDITGRKRMEAALRESELKFAKAFRATPTWLVISDLEDGRFIEINEAFEQICGWRREELIGRTSLEIGLWKDRADREEVVAALLRGGEVRAREVNFRGKNGKQFVGFLSAELMEVGGVQCLVSLVNDITERKEAEVALRESEEKFAKAFRATPTVLVISTMAEGRYLEVNETFEQLTGYRREEAIGRTSLELEIWEKPEARTRFLQTIRKEGKVRNLEANFRSKGGDLFVGLVSAEVIVIGGVKCLLVLVNDITERKRMEEEIELLNSNLASHAIELEAVNRELEAFNYSVSHDLCSPITGIHGYCQLLLELCGDRLGDQGSGFVREIYKAAENMDELITTMLNFSQLARSAMTPEPVDLTGMAKTVAARLKMSEPQRQVTFTVADGVKGEGDAKLLRVVLENLIGNAWKYTGRQETAVIAFGAVDIEGAPAFFVRDNGPGFDMAHADKLFRPFQRLPGARGFAGHGIGLATVQRIIQRHGGRVWAEGEPGQGAAFYFTL